MTPEQREQLDELIMSLKVFRDYRLTPNEQEQIIFYLEILKDLVNRLHGELEKVK